jgi:dTDP-4-dehydrorhamnose 3,5-epimerase
VGGALRREPLIGGEVFEVAVDIRVGSPTFGKPFGTRLSAENNRQLWVPPGFAHGFVATSDIATSSTRSPRTTLQTDERAIAWNDPSEVRPMNIFVASGRGQLGRLRVRAHRWRIGSNVS